MIVDVEDESVFCGSDEAVPHRAALAASSAEALAQGVPGLLRMLDNLCHEEVDPKHRRLRLSNAALKERVLGPLPGALDMLRYLGYCSEEESGEAWLCLEEARWRPATAREEAAWLQGLVERRWQGLPWECPACTLRNAAGVAQCGVCEGPRPAWAAPPDIAMPRLTVAPAVPKAAPQAGADAHSVAEQHVRVERAKNEKQLERDRILAEARADRERFGVPQASPAASHDASGIAAAPVLPQAPAATHAALRIRLPNGAVVEDRFAASATLSLVFDHLDVTLAAMGEVTGRWADYALLQTIPRRVFIREVLGASSLAELGLTPSATLSVLRAEDRGRVQSGGVETALLTGDIAGLSYEEMLELEARMGDATPQARKRRTSTRAREAQTKVHTYGTNSDAKRQAGAASEESRCSICLADFENGDKVRSLWCNHYFHVECIDRWLSEHDECPVCRLAAS